VKVCDGDPKCVRDGTNHGTHVAGTVGGIKSGVAKGVTIHAVKVIADDGMSSTSRILMGIDWAVANAIMPAVFQMSLGAGGRSVAMKIAIDKGTKKNILSVVAAGNNGYQACDHSPAYLDTVITVGATKKGDGRAIAPPSVCSGGRCSSNIGKCVDIWAPGYEVMSASSGGDTAFKLDGGTSMACPHVAGAVAMMLQIKPEMTPAQLQEAILDYSTKDVLKKDIGKGSPNRLLYITRYNLDKYKPPATPAPATPVPQKPKTRRRRGGARRRRRRSKSVRRRRRRSKE